MSSTNENVLDSQLFQPLQLNEHIVLQNRIVLAPESIEKSKDFIPDVQSLCNYYDERTQSPGSLVITEAIYFSLEYTGLVRSAPGIFNDDQLNAWRHVFQKIHDNQCFVFAQLWAPGRQADPEILSEMNLVYSSASPIYENDTVKDRAEKIGNKLIEMNKTQIKNFKDLFIKLSLNLIKAGADGVEIHACYGSLIDQFLNSVTNKRTDSYGGSIEGRARIVLELVDGLINELGSQKVAIRLSPFAKVSTTDNPEGVIAPDTVSQHAYLLERLESRAQLGNRLLYVHVIEPLNKPGLNIDFVSSIWKGTLIRCGGYMRNKSKLIKDVNSGETLIGVGSYFISNPDLIEKLKSNKELIEPRLEELPHVGNRFK